MKMKFVVALAVACLLLSQVNAQQSHPASEISSGEFQDDGNYIIPTSLGIGGSPTQLLEVIGKDRIQLTDPTNPNKWIAFRNQAGGLDLSYQGAPLWLSAYDNQNIIMNPGTGNVGIGATSPGEKLTVAGNIDISGTNGRRIYMGGVSGGNFGIAYSSAYPNYGIFYLEGNPDRVVLSPDGGGVTGSNFVVLGNGNVGIGLTSPVSRLDTVEKGTLGTNPSANKANAGFRVTNSIDTYYLAFDSNQIEQVGSSLYINYGSNTPVLIAYGGGNVGIGTTGPSSKLEVAGNVELTNLYDNDATNFFDGGCGDNQYITGITSTGAISCADDSGYGDISAVNTGTPLTGGCTSGTCNIDITIPTCSGTDKLTSSDGNSFTCAADEGGVGTGLWIDAGAYIYPNNYNQFVITDGGNVGIGTTNPGAKLDVAGQIIAGTAGGGRWLRINDLTGARWELGTGNYDLTFYNDYNDGTFREKVRFTENGVIIASSLDTEGQTCPSGWTCEVNTWDIAAQSAKLYGSLRIGTTSQDSGIGYYSAGDAIFISNGDNGYFQDDGKVTIGNSAGTKPITLRGSGTTVWNNLNVGGTIYDTDDGSIDLGEFELHHHGGDFVMTCDGCGRGDGGRALVQDNADTLVINYGGDFSGGTRVDGNLNMNGNSILNQKNKPVIVTSERTSDETMTVGGNGNLWGLDCQVSITPQSSGTIFIHYDTYFYSTSDPSYWVYNIRRFSPVPYTMLAERWDGQLENYRTISMSAIESVSAGTTYTYQGLISASRHSTVTLKRCRITATLIPS
jgi:hypothetical protein